MNKLEVRETIAGLSQDDIMEIGLGTAVLQRYSAYERSSDLIIQALQKYENEIIRQQEVIARLRQKNRNYRSGMKQLQKSHEASLHREDVLKDTVEQYRQLLVEAINNTNSACQVTYNVGDEFEPIAPYSPVRFNNEPAYDYVPARDNRIG